MYYYASAFIFIQPDFMETLYFRCIRVYDKNLYDR